VVLNMTEPEYKPFDIAEAIRVAEAQARLDLIKRGQAFGFAALLAMLAAIIALAAIGQSWVAGVLAGVGLAGIVAVFVTGRYEAAPVSVPDVHSSSKLASEQQLAAPTAPAIPLQPRSPNE
jgi:hypothetical protein